MTAPPDLAMRPVCLIVQNVYDDDPRVRRKAEALVAAGYPVDVLALRAGPGPATYVLNGVNVRTISLGKRRGSFARYLLEYGVFFLWTSVRTSWQMRRRRYAVIEVNTLPDFLVFAPVLAKWMGAVVMLDLHEITPEFFMSKYGMPERSWTVRLLKRLERVSIAFADHVMTTSEPAQERFASRGLARGKSTVLVNSADEARAGKSPPGGAATLREAGAFVMVYHGTLTRGYGLDLAIEAFARVHSEMPGAQFWILGSGPEASALRRLAGERALARHVKFLGHVPLTAIPGFLAQCDLGILPIRSDVFFDFAFPNKLPEFIVAGVPAIVSRLPVLQRYFSEDAVAYARPNDPEDLARQMLRLYRHPDLRSRLAARATEEYAPIRWDVMKRRYVDLIGDLARTRVGARESQSAQMAPTK